MSNITRFLPKNYFYNQLNFESIYYILQIIECGVYIIKIVEIRPFRRDCGKRIINDDNIK